MDLWRVAVGEEATTALYEPADGHRAGVLFVCAHGAGGHLRDGSLERVTAALRKHGVDIVRFNFLYREHRSKRPDPMPRLERCMRAVIEHARHILQPGRLVIGGRSMGGRTASMLAAGGYDCAGLLLLAYPLHPAGQPEKLRVQHLSRITVPTLCINGTRDALCRRDLMEPVLTALDGRIDMHWLEGADHSFHVLRSSGRSDADVLAEVAARVGRWIAALPVLARSASS